MKNTDAILHSDYIIDGMKMEATPAQMLSECMTTGDTGPAVDRGYPPVVDEPSDPAPGAARYSVENIREYLRAMEDTPDMKRDIPAEFAGAYTRVAIARTLIEALWREGHFSLEDIEMRAVWEWNCSPVGNMAAFYFSAEAASQYLYDLGVRLSGYSIEGSPDRNRLRLEDLGIRHDALFTVEAEDPEPVIEDGGEDAAGEYPEHSETVVRLPEARKCPDTAVPDRRSWLIYIPFDTCPFKLGGSMFSGEFGNNGDNAPDIKDPDYFIDCYEVLRELVEDGIIISGVTISYGGLGTAAERLCRKSGCTLDLKGVESAYVEKDPVRILFSEIPGVLVQIRDSDYDYVDAQLLLQEIAYYPLGHPDPDIKGISISESGRPDVFSILEALLNNPSTSEGED